MCTTNRMRLEIDDKLILANQPTPWAIKISMSSDNSKCPINSLEHLTGALQLIFIWNAPACCHPCSKNKKLKTWSDYFSSVSAKQKNQMSGIILKWLWATDDLQSNGWFKSLLKWVKKKAKWAGPMEHQWCSSTNGATMEQHSPDDWYVALNALLSVMTDSDPRTTLSLSLPLLLHDIRFVEPNPRCRWVAPQWHWSSSNSQVALRINEVVILSWQTT